MNKSCRPVLALALLATSACAAGDGDFADLVLTNGVIVSADEQEREYEALAATDGRIVTLGSAADVESLIGPQTEIIDLEGRTAVPGLIEGHGHYMSLGRAQLELNLTDATSWDDIVAMVAEAVGEAEEGQLITGRGWHQEKWTPRPEPNADGMPFHDAVSAVSPNNPVVLTHASGHATFANAAAMELAGVDASTADPTGGELVRSPDGRLTGVFRETASGLLSPARAGATPADPRAVARLAQEEAFANGITSFHDAGSPFSTVDLWRSMIDEDELKIRLYSMIRASPDRLAESLQAYRTIGYGANRLTVRAIKVSIDGALGSHGAWLLRPYDDLPTSAGLNTTSLADVQRTAELAIQYGYQYNVHAIGDRGNRETLDIFEAAYRTAGEGDHRWRIEHAQHLHPDDIPRFAEIGVIASMQGVHATSDAPWIAPKLGQQRAAEGAYVWRTLMESGAMIMNGTDTPVEDVSPIASYYSSVSRMPNTGEVFFPDQRMTRMEALRSYTINAAYGAFEEDLKGTLEIGKLADVTVLSQNILTIEEERIPDTEVVYTIVGGEVVYRGAGS
ncbi:MAG: amidohydrolase [Gemmatimonadota bacterium]